MKDLILHGDVFASLNHLKNNSINIVITSPPYWKQRDYNFKEQIGQEKTVEEYIGRLVTIFNKLKEKLAKDGIFFLNIGDKYLNRYGKSHLLQIPYRVAFHMVKNGWILEDILIWYKPNHMPSSVKDRFTNTYEPIFVFAKNKNNIYKKKENILKIPLQQTPWKHTAVYPEKLVEEIINRVSLKDNYLILDPFAGTGTTGVVINKLKKTYNLNLKTILIEKGEEFVKIIKERINANIKEIKNINYSYTPIKELEIPEVFPTNIPLNNKNGEVIIAENEQEFFSLLNGIKSEEFKNFHREDALYFFGVKNWTIDSLYHIHSIYNSGYVLRNMIINKEKNSWYPIFMFVKNSKKVAYKFYLDRVRIKPKTNIKINHNLLGTKVKNLFEKSKEGYIIQIIHTYEDNFPQIVKVKWKDDNTISEEFVMHPTNDEILMESIKFLCPFCKKELLEPYDPIGENKCPKCDQILWKDLNSVPIITESIKIPQINFIKTEEKTNYITPSLKDTSSKYSSIERLNWGASPGARKLIIGEYFTKMRMYRINQPLVAKYLTLLRQSKKLSLQELINKFPQNYKHTISHWFRQDFGGSIPIPQDIELLEKTLGVKSNFLNILKKTCLKFQTVKSSTKGKNPGDFFEKSEEELIEFLKLLYLSSHEYLKKITNL